MGVCVHATPLHPPALVLLGHQLYLLAGCWPPDAHSHGLETAFAGLG